MSPLHHLTTIVAVDDDPMFLQSLAFHLDRHQRCEAFVDPTLALEWVQRRAAVHSSTLRGLTSPLASYDMNELPGDPLDKALRVHCGHISAVAARPERIQELACVVVDFDMPRMTGLEFCAQLTGSPVQKILLTGQADESLAIRAFNDGLIDQFIKKGDIAAPDLIRRAVASAQSAYFLKATDVVGRIVCAEQCFLADPAVVTFLAQAMRDTRVVEHFLTVDPPGLLCVNRDGDCFQFLIQNREQILDHVQVAADHDALLPLSLDANEPMQPWHSDTMLPNGQCSWSLHRADRIGDWWISLLPGDQYANGACPADRRPRFTLHEGSWQLQAGEA